MSPTTCTTNALEASTSSLPLPQAAVTQTDRAAEPIPRELGYTFTFSSVSESRHDRRLSADVDLELGLGEELPPYVNPPEYTAQKVDPPTLAMYLFKFGFLFPPFWIIGACILLTPLREPTEDPNAWLPEKTEAERAVIIDTLRKAELKWAWRCLWAFLVVAGFGIAAGITIWTVLKD